MLKPLKERPHWGNFYGRRKYILTGPWGAPTTFEMDFKHRFETYADNAYESPTDRIGIGHMSDFFFRWAYRNVG